MIHAALGRAAPVELTASPRIRGRVARLAVVSAVALALLVGLAVATLDAPPPVLVGLAAGWVTMPIVLAWSLRAPGIRYLVVAPAAVVTLGLLWVSGAGLPPTAAAAVGWLLVTAGVLLGGGLGVWFWFRLLPVPAALDDPLAPGRWALIAVHVGLVAGGLALAASPLLPF